MNKAYFQKYLEHSLGEKLNTIKKSNHSFWLWSDKNKKRWSFFIYYFQIYFGMIRLFFFFFLILFFVFFFNFKITLQSARGYFFFWSNFTLKPLVNNYLPNWDMVLTSSSSFMVSLKKKKNFTFGNHHSTSIGVCKPLPISMCSLIL